MGLNGIGESELLSATGKPEVPTPEHSDIYRLTWEMPPGEKTPPQCVVDADTERATLDREAERLAHEDAECGSSWSSTNAWRSWMPTRQRRGLADVAWTGCRTCHAVQEAARLQWGLEDEGCPCQSLLHPALRAAPDELSSHLDLDACMWLEEELKTFQCIVVLVSHSQNFLDGVCTTRDSSIMHPYVKTRTKLARQAHGKEKTRQQTTASGLTARVVGDKTLSFYFPPWGKIPPPVVTVQIGAGKSTLLKLLTGELPPTDGRFRKHWHVEIGRGRRHSREQLD
ncbi:hypothetical protein P7K49_026056 [Saguinus oedipus]|uniref:ABC transporter domain-containing protein n=1 Tax=Saguinus oedipus TaxID=9490 RepID=A0ABQ9UIX8_SAGOE|nr:hypothetical protein P7K49_026056 [Saguinus oedipus]